MRSPARPLLALALATALAGCGDPALATRWRIERLRWSAEREIRAAARGPAGPAARRLDRAAGALEEIARLAPLERWAGPDPPGDPRVAREVAVLSALALVRRAELDLMRARSAEGIAGLERAVERSAPLPEAARDATRTLAAALDREGRADEALARWVGLADGFEPYDPATGGTVDPVLEAARVAAARLAARGDRAGGAALVAAVERRLTRALEAAGTVPPREAAWRGLAALRSFRGDPAGALAALRAALPAASRGEPGGSGDEAVSALVLDLAGAALAAGWPDSARPYARWAEGLGREPRRAAMRLTAAAWEASGAPDSALEAWGRLIEAYPKAQDSATESRFHRGVLLEGLGRWESARSEFRALAAAYPSHPLAFEAQLRIVRHHLRAAEIDLARLEARRLVKTMEFLIATQHDDEVQRAARRTRGEALLAAGEPRLAFDALSDVWRRWPATADGVEAAWKAAEIAAGPMADRASGDSILSQIAAAAADSGERARARERLRRRTD